MDFIPQWVMGYFIVPALVLSTYIVVFGFLIHLLGKMCKDACPK